MQVSEILEMKKGIKAKLMAATSLLLARLNIDASGNASKSSPLKMQLFGQDGPHFRAGKFKFQAL